MALPMGGNKSLVFKSEAVCEDDTAPFNKK